MSVFRLLKRMAILALVVALSLCALAEEQATLPDDTGDTEFMEESAPEADVGDVELELSETEADFGEEEIFEPSEAEVVQFEPAMETETETIDIDDGNPPADGGDGAETQEDDGGQAETPPAETPAPTATPAPVETPVPVSTMPPFTGNAKRIPVLTYHMVLTDELKQTPRFVRDRYSVSVSAFDRQMAWLQSRNYYAITCEQLYLWRTGQLRLPRKSVLITLDDGYASTIANIIPVLEKYGLRATEFIIGSASYEGRPGFITYDGIQWTRSHHPCIEFQSHSWALHRKNAYKTEKYAAFAADAARQREVYGFDYIAYPYGKNSKAMRKAYRNNGIRMAFLFGSSHDGYATRKQNLFKMKRIEITGGMGMRKFKRWCK